jgi:hypothetical protein
MPQRSRATLEPKAAARSAIRACSPDLERRMGGGQALGGVALSR